MSAADAAVFDTLIDAASLQRLLAAGTPSVVLLDCAFDLGDAAAGERAHAAGHAPGARYAHLERDLSGHADGRHGRHPLPDRAAFARTVAGWGIEPATQVVCSDAQGGVYAARAWWLLRWLGHRAVAVLDGGHAAWRAGGGAWVDAPTAPRPAAAPYPAAAVAAMATIDADALAAGLASGALTLLDARAPERFRGDVEPLDPVAGHIPGAVNRCFRDNLGADGRFRPAAALRADFAAVGAAAGRAAHVVQQCGSGVTACHNLLALAHAGGGDSVLYPGSWSEWCRDPARPVARGG